MKQKRRIWKPILPLFTFLFLFLIHAGTALASTYQSNLVGNCDPYYLYRANIGEVTVTGDTYKDSLCFNTFNRINGEACLDLNGNYTTLSFVAGSVNGKEKNDRTLTVEADGRVIYERVVGYNEIPKAASLSVQGVKQLTIRVSGSPSTFTTFLGNIQLTSKPGYVKNDTPVPSNLLQNCEPYQSTRYNTGTVTMGNQVYENALLFNSFNRVPAEASFNLKGEYRSLSFLLGTSAVNGNEVQERILTIETDGVPVYKQPIFNDEVPKAATIDVTGVYQLTFKLSGSSSTFDTVIGKANLVSNGKVRGVKLNSSGLTLNAQNPAAYLKASITPPDATNPAVTFSSSDSSVASVSQAGLVTGHKAGTATITVKTADGGYTDTCLVTVDLPFSVSDAKIALSQTKYTYDGSPKEPDFTVTYDGDTLRNGTDYTAEYLSNQNAGTGYVKITGKGRYTGTASQAFTILKAKQTISASKKTLTAGKSVKLSVKRTAGNGALSFQSSKPSVAAVSASSGKVTGKSGGAATITIKAAETTNYKATSIKVKVTVKPKNVTLKAPKNSKSRKITISWKRSTAVTGYQIQYGTKANFKGAKSKTISKNRTTTFTTGKLKKNTTYYVRIRTYKTVGKTKYYSDWSSKKSVKIKR